jgi:hypothetical protein
VAADSPARTDGPEWWHDGYLWYPSLSADCRQRFDGERWRPLNPGWHVVRIVALLLVVATPLVLLLSYAYVASEPAYPGQPHPPFERLVALGSLLYVPGTAVLLWWAIRRVGAPGFPAGSRSARRNWVWEPPPGWPKPSALWRPYPGWRPNPRWPAPPPEWRGWTRR